MKKSLLISVFATLAMMISLNALAQEKATGKAYKAIQKDEKVINKDLQKKPLKKPRKQAKELTKEGFKTPVGKLPLDKQLENSWEKQMEIDMNGNPYWYIATSRVIGGISRLQLCRLPTRPRLISPDRFRQRLHS